MNFLKTSALVLVAAAVGVALGYTFFSPTPKVGSTIAYAVPKVGTTSALSVGPGNAVLIVATSSNCTGRAISTVVQPIMLGFGNTQPSGIYGHLQAASTSAFYNNGDYGCGAVYAFGFNASSSISVTTFAQ